MYKVILSVFLTTCLVCSNAQQTPKLQATATPATTYKHACDASAAVMLTDKLFVVASDERTLPDKKNVLWVYSLGAESPVGNAIDLTEALKEGTKSLGEVDTEGAARIGDSIYWIASHSNDKDDGSIKPARHRLYVTSIASDSLRPVKGFHSTLIADLHEAQPKLNLKNKLEQGHKPEVDGINIEGLAATPEGHLLIGFRSPTEPKALLVSLKNGADLLAGKDKKGSFGSPIFLDLGEKVGIRDIGFWPKEKAYLILGGPVGSGAKPTFFLWSGNADQTPREIMVRDLPSDFVAESFVITRNNELHVFSDDGSVSGCKDKPDASKSFRSAVVKLD